MKNLISLFVITVIVSACSSHVTAPKVDDGCIPEKAVKEILQSTESGIDSLSSMSPDQPKTLLKTTLVDQSCYKRTYSRGAYKIIMFRDPNDKRHTVQASIMVPRKFEIAADQCFNRAINDLHELNLKFTDTIINLHHIRYQWLWADPEIGPVKWLNCTKAKDSYYYDSLATFVHELNHELREDNCLLSAIDQKTMCFNIDQHLPNRSISKLDQFKTHDPEDAKSLFNIQKFYLTDTDQPPLFLFDELNSYILTTKVQNAYLQKYGLIAFQNEKKRRTRSFLSLFQLYSARYTKFLKMKEPELFQKNFEKTSSNHINLNKLFDESEIAFKQLQDTLRVKKGAKVDFENGFYSQYLSTKKDF